MFDHLSVGVRDLDTARRFYAALFSPLGHGEAAASDSELAFGPGGLVRQFFVYPVSGERVAGLGSHIAFSAPGRAAVHEAFDAAVAQGATVVRPAGAHPDIASDYYGAVLLDPDGNKLEIVAGPMH